MRLGFVILAHTDLHRVAQLVRHLSDEDCAVSVHIDKNVDQKSFDTFKNDVQDVENIVLAKRTSCEWGRFSLVQATLDASQALLEAYPDVTNVLLISGSCLPIRPVRQLKRFLQRNSKTDYIESVSVENNYWVIDGLNEERFTLYFPFSWRKQRKLFDRWVNLQRRVKIRRKIPEGLVPHIGSQWWCLTSQTLRAIIDDPKRPFYDGYFNWAWIPDESYFQTLARLHSRKIESRSLTFSKFDYLGKPFVFYDDHQKELTLSDCFWARKIWVGADNLYAALLDSKRANQPMSQAKPKEFDEKFEIADRVRCEGGWGRFYQGRYPCEASQRAGVSEMPFTVFVGLKDLYKQFPNWVHTQTGCHSYGSLFARSHVGNKDRNEEFAGNLPAEPKIRNRNPKGYLANILWAHKDKKQSIMYDFRDNPKAVKVFAEDDQTVVVLVKHAWLISLLHKNASFENTLANARRFHRIEQKFLQEFEKKKSKAELRVIDLHLAVEEPAKSLEQTIAHLSQDVKHSLNVMPERENLEGLENLVRKLRNNGLRLDYEASTRANSKKKEETVFEKPYVVK